MSNEKKIASKRVDDVLVASVRFRDGDGEIAEYIKLLQQRVECICGQPLTLYHKAAKGYDLEVCVPVTRAVETGEITSRLLKGGVVLSIVHRGPHSTLGETWELLFDHVERNNITVDGPGREVYLEECVTELQAPLG